MGQKLAAYDATGAIVAFYDTTDSPAAAGATVIEISDAEWLFCISNQGAKIVKDGALVDAPAPDPKAVAAQQAAMILAFNSEKRDQLLADAALRMGPLSDAVALNVATADEAAALTAWRQYRVALSRIDVTQASVAWPSAPGA